MHINLLTAGTLGDVQPFVALAVGLKTAGYEVTVTTCTNFEQMISQRGLGFAPLKVDYYEMMQAPEVPAMLRGNPLPLIKSVRPTIIPMIRQILSDSWEASRNCDALIYHPRIISGSHIAEKLNIPAILGLYLPILSPTREFPFLVLPNLRLGSLNKLSYSMIDALVAPFQPLVNRWRRKTLGLPPRRWLSKMTELNGRALPMIYGFSEHVVPRPADWQPHCHVTGYWFLDRLDDWQPTDEVVQFLDSGPPPVYVGFGSMVSGDPDKLSRMAVDALRANGLRGIISRGWGAMRTAEADDSILVVDSIPHDWLFQKVAAVVHHGGAGTTSAGLRAGKPSVICPFFGDQPYWGKIVSDLGVGPKPIRQRKLTVERLSALQAQRAVTAIAGGVNRRYSCGNRTLRPSGPTPSELCRPAGPSIGERRETGGSHRRQWL